MNRRNFIVASILAFASTAFGRLAFKADRPKPLDVTGQPTPAWLRKGIPGKTYFHGADKSHPFPKGTKPYFNGKRIDYFASEIDAEGGWVRMGKCLEETEIKGVPVPVALDCTRDGTLIEHICFGKVEIR